MQEMSNPRRLVVEGIDDLYSVVGVMRAHISWSNDRSKAPVFIDQWGSPDEILGPEYIDVLLKSKTIQMLGIMVDANSRGSARYERLRQLCLAFFPNIPEKLPKEGMVVDNDDGRRLGAWIMPDNVSGGALEDFLIPLIAAGSGRTLLQHVSEFVTASKTVGARYKDAHTTKANLYSWLALQDPPSQNPRRALYSKALNPELPSAESFVKWF